MNANHKNTEIQLSSIGEMILTLNSRIKHLERDLSNKERELEKYPNDFILQSSTSQLTCDINNLLEERDKLVAVHKHLEYRYNTYEIKEKEMKEHKQVNDVPFAAGEQNKHYNEEPIPVPCLKVTYKTNKSYEKTNLAHTWIMNENVKTKEDRYLTYQNFFFKENIVEYMNTCGGAILINEHKDGGVIYETTGGDIEEYLNSVHTKLEKIVGYSIKEVIIHDTTYFGNVENGKHEFVKYDIQLKGNK